MKRKAGSSRVQVGVSRGTRGTLSRGVWRRRSGEATAEASRSRKLNRNHGEAGSGGINDGVVRKKVGKQSEKSW